MLDHLLQNFELFLVISGKCISNHDQFALGVDCDEVYPGILLGNGATLRNRDYLAQLGVSHILNAAEFRGVNTGEDFFPGFCYKGIRVEDTPQTQICR